MQFLDDDRDVFVEEVIAVIQESPKDTREIRRLDLTSTILVLGDKGLGGVIPNLNGMSALIHSNTCWTHLHPAHPDSKRPTRRKVTLLPLTPLLQRCGIVTILPCTHLQVKHTRMFQPSREVLHEDEKLLPGNIVAYR